jgi:mRNA interferase RelE/StbE
MANYKLELTKTAQKNLKKLDKQTLQRLITKIESLKENPFPAGVKKLITNDGYRIRVGDYRIVYDVFEDLILVKILKVGHRKDIYKK